MDEFRKLSCRTFVACLLAAGVLSHLVQPSGKMKSAAGSRGAPGNRTDFRRALEEDAAKSRAGFMA
jgi:hypothetical protein